MSLNLDRLKNKLAELNNPDKKSGNADVWKPPQKNGEEKQIRVLEYTHGDDPFPELWFHYNIGKRSILCPRKNDNKDCPICQLGRSLWESADKKDKDLAKLCLPTQRYYAAVVDRSDKELTPKFWGFGVTVYKKLLETLTNSRTKHMLELENGYDILVYTVQSEGRKFREATFKQCNEDSPLATANKARQIMAAVKPLREVFKPMTSVEIKEALDAWLNGSPPEEAQAEKQSTELDKGGSAEAPAPDTIEDLEAAMEAADK